jgi:hypothetical protein
LVFPKGIQGRGEGDVIFGKLHGEGPAAVVNLIHPRSKSLIVHYGVHGSRQLCQQQVCAKLVSFGVIAIGIWINPYDAEDVAQHIGVAKGTFGVNDWDEPIVVGIILVDF